MATATKPVKAVKFTIPKTMGACADKLYELRDKRKVVQKQADDIEAEEKAIKAYVIDNLPKSSQTGAIGKLATVRVVTKQIPQIKDIDAFYAYVRKTKRTDLLQKRPSDAAIQELWDAGKTVPGIESFNAVTISLTKA